MHYADYLEYVIEKEGGVGAFIAEAVRNTDVQVPSKAYWKRIREICDKHNVMLIIDDIPNGMGRSGEWFTYKPTISSQICSASVKVWVVA